MQPGMEIAEVSALHALRLAAKAVWFDVPAGYIHISYPLTPPTPLFWVKWPVLNQLVIDHFLQPAEKKWVKK